VGPVVGKIEFEAKVQKTAVLPGALAQVVVVALLFSVRGHVAFVDATRVGLFVCFPLAFVLPFSATLALALGLVLGLPFGRRLGTLAFAGP
jgi:hypothetical protein